MDAELDAYLQKEGLHLAVKPLLRAGVDSVRAIQYIDDDVIGYMVSDLELPVVTSKMLRSKLGDLMQFAQESMRSGKQFQVQTQREQMRDSDAQRERCGEDTRKENREGDTRSEGVGEDMRESDAQRARSGDDTRKENHEGDTRSEGVGEDMRGSDAQSARSGEDTRKENHEGDTRSEGVGEDMRESDAQHERSDEDTRSEGMREGDAQREQCDENTRSEGIGHDMRESDAQHERSGENTGMNGGMGEGHAQSEGKERGIEVDADEGEGENGESNDEENESDGHDERQDDSEAEARLQVQRTSDGDSVVNFDRPPEPGEGAKSTEHENDSQGMSTPGNHVQDAVERKHRKRQKPTRYKMSSEPNKRGKSCYGMSEREAKMPASSHASSAYSASWKRFQCPKCMQWFRWTSAKTFMANKTRHMNACIGKGENSHNMIRGESSSPEMGQGQVKRSFLVAQASSCKVPAQGAEEKDDTNIDLLSYASCLLELSQASVQDGKNEAREKQDACACESAKCSYHTEHYITAVEENCQSIADKTGIDANEILALNKKRYRGLKTIRTTLKAGTQMILKMTRSDL